MIKYHAFLCSFSEKNREIIFIQSVPWSITLITSSSRSPFTHLLHPINWKYTKERDLWRHNILGWFGCKFSPISGDGDGETVVLFPRILHTGHFRVDCESVSGFTVELLQIYKHTQKHIRGTIFVRFMNKCGYSKTQTLSVKCQS